MLSDCTLESLQVLYNFYVILSPEVLEQTLINLTLPPPQPLLAFLKCLTLKNGRQPAKRLPENVRFTTSNSSSEYVSQTTKNSGEMLKQLDSQGISFFISINIFGKSFADVHKKANWLCKIEWHLWCMLLKAQ